MTSMTDSPSVAPPSSNIAPSPMDQALAKRRLGTVLISFFSGAAIGPLLVTAGVIPSAYAATGLTTVPAAFLLTAVVLAIFAIGYIAMARYEVNAGAFYTLITRGLGRPAGVAAAMVALVAYNALQVALYGLVGTQLASYLADNAHWHFSWWACALGVWLVVSALGLSRVDLSAKLLGVLLLIEIAVILCFAVKGLTHPAAGHLSYTSLNPTHLTLHGIGPLAAIAVLGYIGFEQAPVYAEEAKDPRRTVHRATYLCLGVIAVVYTAGSWAMSAAYGTNTVSVAQNQGSGMLFALGPGLLASAGRTLFLTSLLAAALSYHNACWRYGYSLAREDVLPKALARVSPSGVPRTASVIQSVIGLAAIGACLIFHWDPVSQFFYIGGTFGGLGVLLLLAATSFAALVYFRRNPHDEGIVTSIIAPAVSGLALVGMAWACTANLATLFGVSPSDPVVHALLYVYGAAVLAGVSLALWIKMHASRTYDGLGHGTSPVTFVSPELTEERAR